MRSCCPRGAQHNPPAWRGRGRALATRFGGGHRASRDELGLRLCTVQISSGAGDPKAAVVAKVSAMFSTSSAKAVTAAAGIMLSTAACSTGSHDAAVVKVTQAFTSAVQHRDGTAACALLTDDARQAVSGATDIPCAKAVTSAANPGTSVRTVEVWSDTAQVRIGADVIFLRRTGNTWKVSAAGCKPQPAGPYQCTVGG